MYIYSKNSLLFACIFILISILGACDSVQKKSYINPPKAFYPQVKLVCNHTDASHFVVRDLRVWVKSNEGNEIELKHYNSLLPDGYYYCVMQERSTTLLQ